MFVALEVAAQEFYLVVLEISADPERAAGTPLTESAVAHAGAQSSACYPIAHSPAQTSAFCVIKFFPQGSMRIVSGDEFNAIAKRVGGKRAPYRRDRCVVGDFAAGSPEPGEEVFKLRNAQRRMCFFRRTERVLDAKVKLQRAALKPAAAATRKFRWFRQLNQA